LAAWQVITKAGPGAGDEGQPAPTEIVELASATGPASV
jgi:hypothetical protein